MVAWIPPELEHADAGQIRVATNLLAGTIEIIIDGLTDAIRAGSAPSLAQPAVLKGVQNFAILRKNGNSDAHTFEIGLNQVARRLLESTQQLLQFRFAFDDRGFAPQIEPIDPV